MQPNSALKDLKAKLDDALKEIYDFRCILKIKEYEKDVADKDISKLNKEILRLNCDLSDL